jgi:peptide/nickel transport system permease protein
MLPFILRRLAIAIFTLLGISVLAFVIIQLPPGDFLTSKIAYLQSQGDYASEQEVMALRRQYGLDRPYPERYLMWIGGIVRGDLGSSMEFDQPVTELIGERLLLTVIVALSAVLFTWALAIPIGIYSAVRQRSIGDYVFTFFGFIGLSIPDFLIALVLMYVAYFKFGISIGGLFSHEFQNAPWSLARVWDLLKHLWIPAIVLGAAGAAAFIRIIRANLLDELHKPYVAAARARGMPEWRLILKYPVRVALNPFLSAVGYVLPFLVSGSVIVSVVLDLPTVGQLLIRSLMQQDMYLAGAIVLMLGAMTVAGTLLSDILLMLLDPRIRMGGARER